MTVSDAMSSCDAMASSWEKLSSSPVDTSRLEVVKFPELAEMGYLLFWPEALREFIKTNDVERIPDDRKYPLLVFLHGKGEVGDVNEPEGVYGNLCGMLPYNLSNFNMRVDREYHAIPIGATAPYEIPLKLPAVAKDAFFTLCPRTDNGDLETSWPCDQVCKFVRDFLSERGDVAKVLDISRLYITGLSMGGMGALNAAKSGMFAACVPVCPWKTEVDVDAIIEKQVAVYCYHGENDKVCPVSFSDDFIEKLLIRECEVGDAHNSRVNYTKYPSSPSCQVDDGHACWVYAYQDEELYKFLLGHKKTDVSDGAQTGGLEGDTVSDGKEGKWVDTQVVKS